MWKKNYCPRLFIFLHIKHIGMSKIKFKGFGLVKSVKLKRASQMSQIRQGMYIEIGHEGCLKLYTLKTELTRG